MRERFGLSQFFLSHHHRLIRLNVLNTKLFQKKKNYIYLSAGDKEGRVVRMLWASRLQDGYAEDAFQTWLLLAPDPFLVQKSS